MESIKKNEIWFVTGSQHLYGPDVLETVKSNSQCIVDALNIGQRIPVKIVFKEVLTTSEQILNILLAANMQQDCIGIITWMHTFSPAQMWIRGLQAISKPILHFHTQFNREIPWDGIDMDFMNLNQAAHGDREFGFIMSRMRMNRKVVTGFWQDSSIQEKIAIWVRVAKARAAWKSTRIARFGDNMRNVAVTEGDKVQAQIQFNFSVLGFGMGDLVEYVNKVQNDEIQILLQEYDRLYEISPDLKKDGKAHDSLIESARIECGMRNFLEINNFQGFTSNFEDLHGLSQLPGIAVQRLMAEGYGFGAEGDWKTAALLRAMKVMAEGLEGGTSFMEDYTYHMDPFAMKVLGAHMLEVCPSIASNRPRIEIHKLGIGGKADPVRLVFNSKEGKALNASLIDLGNRFRLIVNTVRAVDQNVALPKLPVARVVWEPEPNLEMAATAWILSGGAHHTAYTQALTSEYLEEFAEMTDIEFVCIDHDLRISELKNQLRWNEAYFLLKSFGK